MTTTYHPATNRYAAIVEAVRTPPPPRPRLHLARISLSVPPLAADDAPELAPAPRPSRPAPLTTHGCGYDLDRDAAGRYPVVVAALEGCVP